MIIPELPEDFGYKEEHDLLRKSARRLLADKCPMAEVRRLASDSVGYDTALWHEIAELGWLGLVTPEPLGGVDLGYLALAVLLEEAGRNLLPAPLVDSVLAGTAIAGAGNDAQRSRWCPAIASGEVVATCGFTGPERSWEPDAVSASATRVGDGYALSGTRTHVMWAEHANLMVSPFRLDDGSLALFAVDLGSPGVRVEPEIGVDPTRRAGRVVLEEAGVAADARLAGRGLESWRATLVRGYVALAAEAVGAAQAVLSRTRDYAVERIQFGRPIGSFQAVKHPLVNVMLAVESARSLVYGAAAALDSAPDHAEIYARMAKAAATDALAFAVDRGVQLHGGYGFTWDCDVHFYFKRSLWNAAVLGDARHHRRHVGDALFSR